MNAKQPFKKLFAPLLPFFIAGLTLAVFIGLLFMFSYIILWGFIIGAFLWLISTLKHLLSRQKPQPKPTHQGRIIEHESKK